MDGRHARVAVGLAAVLLTGGVRRAAAETPVPVAGAVSLATALARARTGNPELRAAREGVEVARARLVKARYASQFNPEIGGEVGHRERNEPGESGSTTDFAVTVSQEVEVAGQRSARIAEAEQAVARAEAEVRDRERLLDSAVTSAFFGALVAARRVELQHAIEDLSRHVRDAAAARVQAGEVPVMEANLAEIRYGEARKQTLAAETERVSTLLALRRLLDLPADAALDAAGEVRSSGTEVSPAAALEKALATRPDLVAAMREVERVDAERTLTVRLAVANPTLEGFYRSEERGPDRVAGAGIRIPLPLFDRKQGELAALDARARQARYEVAALRRTIEQEVGEALQQYDNARRTLALFERDVLTRVDENFHFIETAYQAGKIDLFKLILVQNDLVAAQVSYLDSVGRFREAQVQLERAIGAPLGEVMP